MWASTGRAAALVALVAAAGWAAPAAAQVRRDILIENQCRSPIRLLVDHADGFRNWHPHGWYSFEPGEASRLEDNGVTLTQTEDHTLYFYAETTDGTGLVWESGDTFVDFQGARYGTRAAETLVSQGALVLRITCD